MEERVENDTKLLDLGEQANDSSVEKKKRWNLFRRYVGWEKLVVQVSCQQVLGKGV